MTENKIIILVESLYVNLGGSYHQNVSIGLILSIGNGLLRVFLGPIVSGEEAGSAWLAEVKHHAEGLVLGFYFDTRRSSLLRATWRPRPQLNEPSP